MFIGRYIDSPPSLLVLSNVDKLYIFKMTAGELAEKIGCSRVWIYELRKRFPSEAPKDFSDVLAWKSLLDRSRSKARVPYRRDGAKTNGETPERTSDIARLTKLRGDKVSLEVAILELEFSASKRQMIRQEEAIALFGKIATVVRGRLMKMANDLPTMLSGLSPAEIDKIVQEKLREALGSLEIEPGFFEPKSAI